MIHGNNQTVKLNKVSNPFYESQSEMAGFFEKRPFLQREFAQLIGHISNCALDLMAHPVSSSPVYPMIQNFKKKIENEKVHTSVESVALTELKRAVNQLSEAYREFYGAGWADFHFTHLVNEKGEQISQKECKQILANYVNTLCALDSYCKANI